MDVYHIWCDLKPGTGDLDFCHNVERYLGHLKDQGSIADFRIMRRKLGLAPQALAEFHVMIETDDLAQLDRAFSSVAVRQDPIEEFHHAVVSHVQNLSFALYRDFPDAVREQGGERF
jgi:hypothetical protein